MEPTDQEEPPIESPPEGSMCSEHSDRPALVICPRCGSYACLSCWHGAVKRCHACVARHAGPPVPFEDPSRNAVAGFFATLADAGSPLVTAPSFRHPGMARAVVFFVLTFVPLALLSGIVPYTAHLLFGPSFSLELRPADASQETLAFDVVRAMAVGLGVALVQWIALALPFTSLSNAYAERGHPDAPMRAMLYRGWLLALFLLAYTIVPTALPAATGALGGSLLLLLTIVPLLLLLSSMRATTRMGSGVGAVAAFVTIGVPFALMLGSGVFLERGVRLVVPELAQLQDSAQEAAEREASRPGDAAGAPSTSTATP